MDLTVPIQETESAGTVFDTNPDVDTVLIIGPYERCVGVRSNIVTAASPVFKAMLGRKAKHTSNMTEILLPMDDAEAAETTFDILHGHNGKHPSERSPGALYRLALFVNKYDCFKPMKDAFRSWARDMRKKSSALVWTWAMVSVILRDRGLLAKATEVLVLIHSGLYIDLITGDQVLPDARTQYRIAAILEETRGKLRAQLAFNAFSKACRWLYCPPQQMEWLDVFYLTVLHASNEDSLDRALRSMRRCADATGGDMGCGLLSILDDFMEQDIRNAKLCLGCVVAGAPHLDRRCHKQR